MKYEFSQKKKKDFPNNTQMRNFIEIRPVWAELFHADGRTGMTKRLVTFRNFANAQVTTGSRVRQQTSS